MSNLLPGTKHCSEFWRKTSDAKPKAKRKGKSQTDVSRIFILFEKIYRNVFFIKCFVLGSFVMLLSKRYVLDISLSLGKQKRQDNLNCAE